MKKYYPYFSECRKLLIFSFSLLLGALSCELLLPQISGETINYLRDVAAGKVTGKFDLWPYVISFLCLSVLRSVINRRKGIIDTSITTTIIKNIRCRVYDKLQKLSFNYHDNTASGQIISRVIHDVNVMRGYFATLFFTVPEIIIFLLGATVLMLNIHVKLTLVALCTAPVTVYLMIKFKGALHKLWRKTDDLYGDVSTVLQENIAGVKVVKSFAKENYEIKKFNNKVNIFLDSFTDAVSYWAKRVPMAHFIFGLSMPLALWYGGILVIRQEINIGDLTKVLFYLMGYGWRISRIGHIVNTIENAHAAGDRICEIIDTKTEIADKEHALTLNNPSGSIEFANVSFSYKEGKNVVQNVSFKIKPGEIIGITGPTGSGKTSLINLLPRFYEPLTGKICVDGVDIRNIRLDSLRKTIKMVFQETLLFSATISENIAYGKPDASHEEVENCAQLSQAAGFINGFEKKYDTIVGERGVTLSGGQKQRVSIARAVLPGPKILVLDNPTSNLDSEVERIVIENILNLKLTIIIISQKMNVLRKTDRIYVMEDGLITASGTHQELISKEGFYKEIYEEQVLLK
ncbi:MAG: hypothetical protein A2252_11585 [Elusimicrobia bacterium RIFOXYA2_FULL_39_19]|nr:MAG: hypothetical protein A2252_11585 [Elusimicrobia bacterium RIFOXYA2_FULL_39_19]